MTYQIEYQDSATNDICWCSCEGRYSSQEEALRAVNELIAVGGPWRDRAYRVSRTRRTSPTHAELARLVEGRKNYGALVAWWFGDDGTEAALFDHDEIAAAVPGGPIRRGWLFGRSVGEVVREIVAGDHEAVARERAAAVEAQQRAAAHERERAAAVEAQQRAAAQERERAAAVEAQQRVAAEERERVAKQERERAAAQERERVAALEARQRAAAQERERVAAWEAQQRAAAQERERVAAWEAQQRAAAQERERVATQEQEQERVAALKTQQRAAAQARERAAAQERERVATQEREREYAAARERERAAAVDAQRRATAQERKVEAPVAQITRPVATPLPVAAVVQHPPVVRVAQPQQLARVVQQLPVGRVAQPAPVAGVVQPPKLGGDGELVALARLLRCGAWREGMRASDLLTTDQFPPGVHRALQELAGAANPTVRALGNALKRVQDKCVDGITRKLTRKVDNHGFAIWQVVDDLGETSKTSDRPGNAELLRGALTGMGYRLAEANYAVSALRDRIETDPLSDLVREALGVLSQRPVSGSESKRR